MHHLIRNIVDLLQKYGVISSRKKNADQSSAYHEAYKKAVQEGSDQEDAKGKAMAVPCCKFDAFDPSRIKP